MINILKVILIVVMSSSFGGCNTSQESWPYETFSSEAWKTTPVERRYVYFNNLVRSKKLDGLSKKEVVAFLGEPDYKSPDGKYITYLLKYAEKGEYSFNAVYLLQIDFDTHWTVSQYFLRAD